jgi:hypothetical protein
VSDSVEASLKEVQDTSFTGNLETSVDVEAGEEAVTELHRLSSKVKEIDFDVSIVPHKSYVSLYILMFYCSLSLSLSLPLSLYVFVIHGSQNVFSNIQT